jgi:TRAP-type C4-dicarboxylate transport system permease small subunit
MNHFLDRFERGFIVLSKFFAGLVALSIGLIALLIPLDLLIRSLEWGNMPWLHEGIEYTLYAGVFLGAPWVLQQGAHVKVDILIEYLPKKISQRIEIIIDLIGFFICLLLCYYSLIGSIDAFIDQATPDKLLKIANWKMIFIFTISFLMLAFEFLLRIRRAKKSRETQQTMPKDVGF